jgi:hypothetical protein
VPFCVLTSCHSGGSDGILKRLLTVPLSLRLSSLHRSISALRTDTLPISLWNPPPRALIYRASAHTRLSGGNYTCARTPVLDDNNLSISCFERGKRGQRDQDTAERAEKAEKAKRPRRPQSDRPWKRQRRRGRLSESFYPLAAWSRGVVESWASFKPALDPPPSSASRNILFDPDPGPRWTLTDPSFLLCLASLLRALFHTTLHALVHSIRTALYSVCLYRTLGCSAYLIPWHPRSRLSASPSTPTSKVKSRSTATRYIQ